MRDLKSYFYGRTGGKLQFSAEAAFPATGRRDYEVHVRGIKGDTLMTSVSWLDVDRDGRRVPGSRSEQKVVHVPLRGLEHPAEAIEDAARMADPDFFAGRPLAARNTGGAEADALERRLAALATPEGRAEGEAAPQPGSVTRLRTFWSNVPNLVAPDVFSSADGTLRARWNHGHDRTLWINFPEKGPLGWSASVPRDGRSGLCKMNARCPDDEDILQLAALLGIRCTR